MRYCTAPAAILCCLAIGLAGCSTTSKSSSGKSWWQSLSFKSKKSENLASSNAPSAPTFGSTASPTVTMPQTGYASSAAPYGAAQYPVTPYPPTTVPGAGAYAANTAGAGGYMPPSDPYATAASAYGAQQATANPYVAANTAPQATAYTQQANPYAAQAVQPAPTYTAAEQYNAYQGAPAAAGTTPYSYR